MSERCQTQSKEINNKILVIAVATTGVLIALLFFYRFHFLAICFTYILGCVACYICIQFNLLQLYLEKIPTGWFRKPSITQDFDEGLTKGCASCGAADCARHDARRDPEPWVGLRVHKQLDQAIEDFYNAILEQFVSGWYDRVSQRPWFVDRLRRELRRASAVLLRRARQVDYSRFIARRALPCVLRHYMRHAAPGAPGAPCAPSAAGAPAHPALAGRAAELDYLRALADAVMPYLVHEDDLANPVYCEMARELLAGWVLLSLTDVLADPYILNTLIVQATGDETMAALPATPSYHVEFLETFARHSESAYAARGRLLRLDLDQLLDDQEYFYAFMQHMKSAGNIYLLQFYKDIKSFQTRLLNPELTPDEEARLTAEAWALHDTYLSPGASQLPLGAGCAAGVREALRGGVTRLRQSQEMYQAARTARSVLDSVMLASLLHSEEFYKLFFGSRIPTGYHKQMNKRARDGPPPPATPPDAAQPADGAAGGLPRCLDAAAAAPLDLSTYKVVFTDVEVVTPAGERRAPVRVFTVAVHAARGGGATLASVRRAEPDLHLLRAKLLEFHGERRLPARPLPSRRDNSPLETLRYKYEDFIQTLLQTPLFQTSELLHLFLTAEGDFSLAVQASMAGNNTELANIYHSVAHRLRKEKGQHLESFLCNFLVSCDMERYQAAVKQGAVDEAIEVNEELDIDVRPRHKPRSITGGIFGNNLNLKRVDFDCAPAANRGPEGFTECFMYILMRVLRAPRALVCTVGGLLGLCGAALDGLAEAALGAALRARLCERRLAHLVRLAHAQIFSGRGGGGGGGGRDARAQAARARRRLERAPRPLRPAAAAAHRALQDPVANKQLVYDLLDLSITELFPELAAQKCQPFS